MSARGVFVGHAAQIPQPHDFIAGVIGRTPIILQRDGRVCALLNLCSHRGATVATTQAGTTRRRECPYHGWMFGRDRRHDAHVFGRHGGRRLRLLHHPRGRVRRLPGQARGLRNARPDEHRALCGLRRGNVELTLKLGGLVSREEHDFLELLVRESTRPVTWLAVVDAAVADLTA